MTDILIDDVAPLITYQVGATPTSVFAVPFVFFEDADLEVRTAPVATPDELVLLVLDSDYTVAGEGSDDDAARTVTMTAPVTSVIVQIRRNITIERVTDFPSAGPLNIPAINEEFDRVVAIEQELKQLIGEAVPGIDQSAGFSGTSATAVTLGTGSKAFVTQSGKFFGVGAFLLATSNANPTTHYLFGQVTAYNSSTGALTLSVVKVSGGGSRSDWTIRVSGAHTEVSDFTGQYDTLAAAQGATIVENNVALFGETVVNDRLARRFKRVGAAPAHNEKFDDAVGAHFEFFERVVHTTQFGAIGTADDTVVVQKADDYAAATGSILAVASDLTLPRMVKLAAPAILRVKSGLVVPRGNKTLYSDDNWQAAVTDEGAVPDQVLTLKDGVYSNVAQLKMYRPMRIQAENMGGVDMAAPFYMDGLAKVFFKGIDFELVDDLSNIQCSHSEVYLDNCNVSCTVGVVPNTGGYVYATGSEVYIRALADGRTCLLDFTNETTIGSWLYFLYGSVGWITATGGEFIVDIVAPGITVGGVPAGIAVLYALNSGGYFEDVRITGLAGKAGGQTLVQMIRRCGLRISRSDSPTAATDAAQALGLFGASALVKPQHGSQVYASGAASDDLYLNDSTHGFLRSGSEAYIDLSTVDVTNVDKLSEEATANVRKFSAPLPTTVGALMSAATAGAGYRDFVTDANATCAAGIGTTVVGGGANKVPIYSDGTNWKIG
ncbi:MAG: hypothetical protein Q7R45_08415 [Sulfuricaulis sp.]|nr:hypothetical protein [Sulfuricaulis sp.]